ncbi:MAG: DUF4870 domain-containing protein [Pyrinomonadaceae bacterium]
MSYQMQPMGPVSLQTADEKQMGMFLHLAQLVNVFLFPVGIIVPIVLWQTQKEKMPALDAHGKMVANWMISSTIYAIVSIPLILLFFVGLLTLIAVGVMGLIFPIIGAVKANNGELWEYPLTIKFLK